MNAFSYALRFRMRYVLALYMFLCGGQLLFAQQRAMTIDDIMRFRSVSNHVISADGAWIGYTEQPDRGDGVARIQSVGSKTIHTIERGGKVTFSANNTWAMIVIQPKFLVAEKALPANRPDAGLTLLHLASGTTKTLSNVARAQFAPDGQTLVVHYTKNKKAEGKDTVKAPPRKPGSKQPEAGTMLAVINLAHQKEAGTVTEQVIPAIKEFAIDTTSRSIALTQLDPQMRGAMLVFDIQTATSVIVDSSAMRLFTHPAWSADRQCAYLSATILGNGTLDVATLNLYQTGSQKKSALVRSADVGAGFVLPSKNSVRWSKDNQFLLFGAKPAELHDTIVVADQALDTLDADVYNQEKLLKTLEADVWHWNDDFLSSQQKKNWEQWKDRTVLCQFQLKTNTLLRLGDRMVNTVLVNDNTTMALGIADTPYRKEIMYDGSYADWYMINRTNGTQIPVVKHIAGGGVTSQALSPRGKYVVFYRNKHWHLFNAEDKSTRNLTAGLSVHFEDEDHDSPSDAPAVGFAGWIEQDEAVLVYDRYDVWKLPTNPNSQPVCITAGEGRKRGYELRIVRTDDERRNEPYSANAELLLTGFHSTKKNSAFFACTLGKAGVTVLLEGNKLFTFIAKAKNGSAILYTQTRYEEFPDIRLTTSNFRESQQMTFLGKQLEAFAWGGNAELIEWKSTDGVPLQGVLIKPGNYVPGKRYPVFVYYYEIFSDRLHQFNTPTLGHRPPFAFYTSNDYAIFLPDVRYAIGLPGQSAVKCLVPGVQKLIDMGIADPKGIGLHGHSWSGYQTLFVITQTNIFSAAIAGAAVSNMTSAYGGIRLESGLARPFQYEKAQSRIGKSMWERRDLYIDNSPLFFADRIETPTLMEFGDEDDAVPYLQGIEMYVAMRRLQKNCILLQYRKEPHHLKKSANKLDYTVKMKEYFDHYLKGTKPADWIVNGSPYRGK